MSIFMKKLRYVLTDDIYSIFSKLQHFNGTEEFPTLSKKANNFAQLVKKILAKSLRDRTTVDLYSKPLIEAQLAGSVIRLLENYKNSLSVCLDRSLLVDLELSPQYNKRFFRFQICRTHNNVKVPRHNTPSFALQIKSLKNKMKKYGVKKLIIVDIGIFSGKTIQSLIELFNKAHIACPITHIVTYLCKPEIKEKFKNIKLITHVQYNDLYEWVDLHDFTPFGGKILLKSRISSQVEAVPCLFPWSDGRGASLHLEPNFFSISKKLIKSFSALVKHHDLQNPQNPMNMQSLINGGFSIPNNSRRAFSYTKNMRLTHYLNMCLDEITIEENRKVLIFDMDGTLYNYKNENGFSGSKLNKIIERKAITYIRNREKCSLKTAKAIYDVGSNHRVGLSVYLSKKYNISRREYFNAVWNIDPKRAIKKSNIAPIITQIYKERKYKLILLTSAPYVWANQVLKYLGIGRYFDTLYCAEDYGNKDEIFKMISKRYNPSNCLSIGDQKNTDILPAKKYGLKAWLVKEPEDLKNWKDYISI